MSNYTIADMNLHNADGPITVVEGVGHDRAEMVALGVQEFVYVDIPRADGGVPVVLVEEGRWGWTRSIKHCEKYTDGWGCDQCGSEWHRHYIPMCDGEPMTLVSVSHWVHGTKPVDYDEWLDGQKTDAAAVGVQS